MPLKKSDKYALKSQAHHLKPSILLGAKGLTDAVMQEIDIALTAHELIKVKLTGVEREDKEEVLETICQQLKAEMIQVIGRIATFYRKRPEEKRKMVARASEKKPQPKHPRRSGR